eukprot:tig00021012_g17017.t1
MDPNLNDVARRLSAVMGGGRSSIAANPNMDQIMAMMFPEMHGLQDVDPQDRFQMVFGGGPNVGGSGSRGSGAGAGATAKPNRPKPAAAAASDAGTSSAALPSPAEKFLAAAEDALVLRILREACTQPLTQPEDLRRLASLSRVCRRTRDVVRAAGGPAGLVVDLRLPCSCEHCCRDPRAARTVKSRLTRLWRGLEPRLGSLSGLRCFSGSGDLPHAPLLEALPDPSSLRIAAPREAAGVAEAAGAAVRANPLLKALYLDGLPPEAGAWAAILGTPSSSPPPPLPLPAPQQHLSSSRWSCTLAFDEAALTGRLRLPALELLKLLATTRKEEGGRPRPPLAPPAAGDLPRLRHLVVEIADPALGAWPLAFAAGALAHCPALRHLSLQKLEEQQRPSAAQLAALRSSGLTSIILEHVHPADAAALLQHLPESCGSVSLVGLPPPTAAILALRPPRALSFLSVGKCPVPWDPQARAVVQQLLVARGVKASRAAARRASGSPLLPTEFLNAPVSSGLARGNSLAAIMPQMQQRKYRLVSNHARYVAFRTMPGATPCLIRNSSTAAPLPAAPPPAAPPPRPASRAARGRHASVPRGPAVARADELVAGFVAPEADPRSRSI